MAKGDAVGTTTSIAAGISKIIQPAAGIEWVVHNVYHGGAANIYITDDGVDTLLFASSGGKGSWSAYFFHLTNGHYLKVKNIESSAKLMSYDGVVSKE